MNSEIVLIHGRGGNCNLNQQHIEHYYCFNTYEGPIFNLYTNYLICCDKHMNTFSSVLSLYIHFYLLFYIFFDILKKN